MSYFFNPKARVEHLEHVAYYESRQQSLGARYLAAFNAAMVKVCASPHRYKIEFPRGTMVVLLCGGDKSTQSRDIETAQQILKEWRQHDD